MQAPAEFGVRDEALHEIIVPNDLHSAKEPEERILQELADRNYDPDTTFAIKLALEEAMTNAVKHGNKFDCHKQIVVRYHVDDQRCVIMVRDQGVGFRPECVPDPTTEENIERPNGRGIMLMCSYMTQVRFSPEGNEVWMLKEKHED